MNTTTDRAERVKLVDQAEPTPKGLCGEVATDIVIDAEPTPGIETDDGQTQSSRGQEKSEYDV